MIVKIEAPFTITNEQEGVIKEAVTKLARYNNKMSQGDVYFKLGNGHTPDSVLAEIEVHVPGPTLFTSDDAEDFMDAFKGALNKMDRNLRKEKDKRQSKR